jgi:3-hydroxyisobutyrate dehydrogenase-like beta-hydroxyacid dehydrogenase
VRCGELPVYIDGNSVSPLRKREIADVLSRAGLSCLDGAFFGPAGQVGSQNLLALSGPCAELTAPFFRQFVEVQVMGKRIGPPAALKMALGILTKALCALFLEMVCASGNESQLDAVLDLMRRFYPGTMRFVERSLPTYPMHVARKADELDEVHRWLNELRVRGDMTRSAGTVLRLLENAGLDQSKSWKFDELVREIVRRDILRSPPEPSRELTAIGVVPVHTTV